MLSSTAEMSMRPLGRFFRLPPEIIVIAVSVVAAVTFPDDLGFMTRINIFAVFALSVALVIGQAGIGTLGQAAMFGVGSYAAALWSLKVGSDPTIGLLIGAVAGGATAALSGLLVLRTRGLTLIMLTVAFAQVLLEIANKAAWLTGGDDGLAEIPVSPVLGLFTFDFRGTIGFYYSLSVLVVVYFCLRRLAASPFGLVCRGIKGDAMRMRAIGTPVFRHLVIVYTIGGAVAGIAGALSAQTTQVVGLNNLGFENSAEVVVMVAIGGMNHLAGALVGVPLFMIVRHIASTINPYHWLLVIGCLLIFVMLVFPKGIVGSLKWPAFLRWQSDR